MTNERREKIARIPRATDKSRRWVVTAEQIAARKAELRAERKAAKREGQS